MKTCPEGAMTIRITVCYLDQLIREGQDGVVITLISKIFLYNFFRIVV